MIFFFLILRNSQFSFYFLIQNFILFGGNCKFDRFWSISFWWLQEGPRGSRHHKIIHPPSSFMHNPIYSAYCIIKYTYEGKKAPWGHDFNEIFMFKEASPKNLAKNWQKIGNFCQNFLAQNWLKWKFIIQLAYGDKNLCYNFFSFVIEKFDFPVKMPWEKEVLWICSKSHEPNIFIFTFLWRVYTKVPIPHSVQPGHFRLEL